MGQVDHEAKSRVLGFDAFGYFSGGVRRPDQTLFIDRTVEYFEGYVDPQIRRVGADLVERRGEHVHRGSLVGCSRIGAAQETEVGDAHFRCLIDSRDHLSDSAIAGG